MQHGAELLNGSAGRFVNERGSSHRNHLSARSTLRSVLFVSLVFATCPTLPTLAQEYTLEQVRDGYRASIKALNPVWTTCRYSRTSEKPTAHVPDLQNCPVEWGIDGAKFYYNASIVGVGPPDWFSYDGKVTWDLYYHDLSSATPEPRTMCAKTKSLQSRTDAELRANVTPGVWLGLYFWIAAKAQSGESFSSMLGKPDAELLGSETVDGVMCAKVKLVYTLLTDGNTPARPLTVWFDPQHGFLPCQFQYNYNSGTMFYQVRQFISEPTGNGSTRHFPREMVVTSTPTKFPSSSKTLVVDEWKIGERIPLPAFQPKLAQGVRVFHMDNAKDQSEYNKFTMLLENPHVFDAVAAMRTAPAAPAARVSNAPAIEAVATGYYTLTNTLLLAGVICSLMGAYYKLSKK